MKSVNRAISLSERPSTIACDSASIGPIAVDVPVDRTGQRGPHARLDEGGGRRQPVDWAIEAGRSATAASPDWGLIATDVGLLAALLAVCVALATRAFRSYQASV